MEAEKNGRKIDLKINVCRYKPLNRIHFFQSDMFRFCFVQWHYKPISPAQQ